MRIRNVFLLLVSFISGHLSAQTNISVPSKILCAKIQRNSLFIGTESQGVLVIDNVFGASLTPVPKNISGLPAKINDIAFKDDSSWAAATDQGLFLIKGDRITESYDLKSGLPSDVIQCLEVSPNGSLWIGTDKGLGSFFRNNYKSYNQNLGLPDDNVRFLRSDQNNRMWVATSKGLTRIDDGKIKVFPMRGIVSLTLDNNGTPYFGLNEGGIAYLKNDSIAVLRQFQKPVFHYLCTDDIHRIRCLNSDTMLLELTRQKEVPVLSNLTDGYHEIKKIRPNFLAVDIAGNSYFFGDFRILIKHNAGEEKPYAERLHALAEENTYLGRYEESKFYYELLTARLNIQDPAVLRDFAATLEKLGDQDNAIRMYEKAVVHSEGSSDPVYLDALQSSRFALVGLYASQNPSKAEELLRQLNTSGGSSAEKASLMLADYYLTKRDTVTAIQQYENHVRDYPNGSYLAQAQNKLMVLYEARQNPLFAALQDTLFHHPSDLEQIHAFDSIYQIHHFQTLLESYAARFPDLTKGRYTFDHTITCAFLENQTLWLGTNGGGVIRISPVLTEKTVTYAVTVFTADSGLVSNYVNDITVDAKGIKWFSCGTVNEQGKETGGLSKFDNIKWTKFTSQQGLVSNRILSAAATKSKIYAANPKGLFAAANSNYPNWYKVALPANAEPENLLADPRETLWFTSGNKIYSGSEQKKFIEVPFDSTVSLRDLRINRIQMDETGGVIALTNAGVYKFDAGIFKLYLEPKDSADKDILTYLVDQGGHIYWGRSGNMIRQTEQAAVSYTTADGLPSDTVLRIFPFYKEQIVVTNRGVWYHAESARDTAQWLKAVHRELQASISAQNWNRVRTISRSMFKQNTEPDYFVYQIARSYEGENKPVESLNYLNDFLRSRGRTKFVNEYAFFRLAKSFENLHDYERAAAIYDGMIRAFSSASSERDLRLQDPAPAVCDVSTEGNALIKNLENSYVALAVNLLQNKKTDQALQIFKRIPVTFVNSPHPSARAALYAYADSMRLYGDNNGLLKVQRTFTRSYPDPNDPRYSQTLYASGVGYQKLDQHREASQVFRELTNLPKIVLLRPELAALFERTTQMAELGLRTSGGFSETNSINTMEFEGNFLWLGTSKGIVRWDMSGGGYKKITAQNGLLSDYVYAMLIDSSGGKWFATANLGSAVSSGGVSYFDGESFTNYTTANGLASNKVRAIAQDRNGAIWIGTDAGVSKFENLKWTNYDLKKTHDFATVTDLYFDKDGQLWIGLMPKTDYENQTGGVVRFDPVKPTVYLKKNGLNSNSVKSIKADPSGQLWFSTGKGLSILDPVTNVWRTITKKDGLISDNVRSVEGLGSDRLWIATDQGLMSWTNPTVLATRSADADNTQVKKVFSEKEGLATNDIRVIRSHPEFGTWIGSKRGTFSVGNFSAASDEKDTQGRNNKLFEVSTESEALFDRAQKYIEQGDYDKAREVYLDVLDRVANSEWTDDATYLLAKSYELEGQYEEAEKTYQKLVKEHPESDLVANAYIGLGTIYEKQKDFEKAEKAFTSAETAAKDKATVEQARILTEKAKVKLVTTARAATEDLAQQISQKYVELEQAKTDEERNRIKSEIAALEAKANVSAKAGGYQMNLYKVREGESLWYLSEKFLGDAKKWKDFFIANEGKISDPNLIVTGQTIVVLTIEKGYREKMDKFLFYDVTPGEDLETIAAKLYGDKEKWKAIYELNKEKVPFSPRKSLSRMKIIIPVYDN